MWRIGTLLLGSMVAILLVLLSALLPPHSGLLHTVSSQRWWETHVDVAVSLHAWESWGSELGRATTWIASMVVIECHRFLGWCHLIDQDHCIFFTLLIFVFGGPRVTLLWYCPKPHKFPGLEMLRDKCCHSPQCWLADFLLAWPWCWHFTELL